MATDPTPPHATSFADLLERVLDKGIVIDAHVRVSVVGIDLVTVSVRIVAASIETYLHYGDALELNLPPGGFVDAGWDGPPMRDDD